jgi:hypothetical protein
VEPHRPTTAADAVGNGRRRRGRRPGHERERGESRFSCPCVEKDLSVGMDELGLLRNVSGRTLCVYVCY